MITDAELLELETFLQLESIDEAKTNFFKFSNVLAPFFKHAHILSNAIWSIDHIYFPSYWREYFQSLNGTSAKVIPNMTKHRIQQQVLQKRLIAAHPVLIKIVF